MAHIHEKIDFVADVLVVHGDAVFLRMHDKYHIWLPPGGHVELDEDPSQAAVREVKEEVGLDVVLVGDIAPQDESGDIEVLVPRFLNRHFVNDTHEHIAFVYFGTSSHRNVVEEIEREKSSDIRWFTKADLEDPSLDMLPRVRMYALKALEELGS